MAGPRWEYGFKPDAPSILPEGALPKLSFWGRLKIRLRCIGLKAGVGIGLAGALAALVCGFDLSLLLSLQLPGHFALNAASGSGIVLSILGGSWAVWSKVTGVAARQELAALILHTLRARTDALTAMLTDAYDTSAQRTLEAFQAIKDKETETESEFVSRIRKTAAGLSVEVEPDILAREPEPVRRKA